jgi:uncharacterized lipoprotein YajG
MFFGARRVFRLTDILLERGGAVCVCLRDNKELTMKTISMLTGAMLLVAGSAYAQSTTVIQKEGVGSERTVVRQDAPVSTTVEKRTTTESVGCSSKSVTRTDEVGDKVTKTKTDC